MKDSTEGPVSSDQVKTSSSPTPSPRPTSYRQLSSNATDVEGNREGNHVRCYILSPVLS